MFLFLFENKTTLPIRRIVSILIKKKYTRTPVYNSGKGIQEPFNQCRQGLPNTYLHNGYMDIVKADTIYNWVYFG